MKKNISFKQRMEAIENQQKKNRDREPSIDIYEIVKDIFHFLTSIYHCKKTEIAFGASMICIQQKRYTSLLMDGGLSLISSRAYFFEANEISDLCRKYLQMCVESQYDLRSVIDTQKSYDTNIGLLIRFVKPECAF